MKAKSNQKEINGMEVKKILSYTIPLYGNRRIFPYGRMRVEHEGKE